MKLQDSASKNAKISTRSPDATPTNEFLFRHIAPSSVEQADMLSALGVGSLGDLMSRVVPEAIAASRASDFEVTATEAEVLEDMARLAEKNKVYRSFLGLGYHDTVTPPVIQRTIFENPGWYTQYTPYQAEIAQGRLEALLNFQTLTIDLTGLPVANASLLDEGTAVAEAMAMARVGLTGRGVILVDEHLHVQSRAVLETRARALGVRVETLGAGEAMGGVSLDPSVFAIVIQYPGTQGLVREHRIADWITRAKAVGARVIFAADPLALTVLKSPGEWGADIAVGSFQRFGVPLGFGGPHAAYLACTEEFKRSMPGRIVGVSRDAEGRPAIRLALQTREQHIRREKATSNICTAQVLLAVMASMYAVYHGPDGLRAIALRIHGFAERLRAAAQAAGVAVGDGTLFDTVCFTAASPDERESWIARGLGAGMNFRREGDLGMVIALDECVREPEFLRLLAALGWADVGPRGGGGFGAAGRTTPYMMHKVFHQYRSEHAMLRYIASLERKDLSLNFSMIPLGSCTMKLNAAVEMMPVTFAGFSRMHPAAPLDQAKGYLELFADLETRLAQVTGFAGISLQPNAGSQGEYAGLLVIRAYHESRGDSARRVCLIPRSAHGTNPASAVMAGFEVVTVNCDSEGNVDVEDLRHQVAVHGARVGALMVTYPSTHGVFESRIREICEIVHGAGGQVYMDGANMNAQVELCRPGEFGADVCHLNLHKTFCIPHGGGGPGMGPIGVARHLVPFLPAHPFVGGGRVPVVAGALIAGAPVVRQDVTPVGAISAAPFGSASILPIPSVYMRLMGPAGLRRATEVAILNANYIARRLEHAYPVLYKGESGWVAHECIIDLRTIKAETGVEVEDVAKRLMDYGFHAPTVSFPVAGTMMIEPTESESKEEMDRFIDAMLAIHAEIEEIRTGLADRAVNLLKMAPHTQTVIAADHWDRPYSRERAAFPLPWVRERKFWPSVSRIDGVYGDRNLVCSCS